MHLRLMVIAMLSTAAVFGAGPSPAPHVTGTRQASALIGFALTAFGYAGIRRSKLRR